MYLNLVWPIEPDIPYTIYKFGMIIDMIFKIMDKTTINLSFSIFTIIDFPIIWEYIEFL